MKIELNEQQMQLISEFIGILEISIRKENGKVIIEGHESSFRSILDELSDLLIEKGLIINTDEPNELGLEIENLIDIIGHQLFNK